MFPYLDLGGFRTRVTTLTTEDVDMFASRYPRYIEQQIARRSSYINSRLRKRYGNGQAVGNSLPLGQTPPLLVASGTAPPGVTLTGRPVLGSLLMYLQITSGGALGTAVFQWSTDGGATFIATGVATGAAVVLGATGLTAGFGVGTYGTDNVYAAAPPVPEAVLGWLTDFVAIDVWERRGANPQDPLLVRATSRFDQAMAELKEAADSKDGLFDLPVSEDLDSAVTTAGPLGFADSSPYAWQDRQQNLGRMQDANPMIPPGEKLP